MPTIIVPTGDLTLDLKAPFFLISGIGKGFYVPKNAVSSAYTLAEKTTGAFVVDEFISLV